MRALLSGTLHDVPAMKTSQAGKDYSMGKIRDDSTSPATYATIFCFGTLAEEFAGMGKGDSLAVSGSLKVDMYQPANGDPRVNLTISADSISTLKKPKAKGGSKTLHPAEDAETRFRNDETPRFDTAKYKEQSGYKQPPPPPPPTGDDPF